MFVLFGCIHVYTHTPPFFKIFGYYYIIYYHNILTQYFLFLFDLGVFTPNYCKSLRMSNKSFLSRVAYKTE